MSNFEHLDDHNQEEHQLPESLRTKVMGTYYAITAMFSVVDLYVGGMFRALMGSLGSDEGNQSITNSNENPPNTLNDKNDDDD